MVNMGNYSIPPENVTGWTQLMDGNIVGAAWTMYNTALVGWMIGILFIIFQILILWKTRNPMLAWTVGAVMLLLIYTYIIATVFWVIFAILVFELVAVLYMIFWK